MADQYEEIRRAIASGNPLTVYMHREAMMTPLEGDVRELVRELDAIRADRDSWEKQASDRADDALRFAREADALREDVAKLRGQS